MRRLVCTFCALVLLLSVVGCGTNNKEAIVGKWTTTEEKDKYSYEFTKDGKVIWSDGKNSAEGKYTWVDDKTIEIEYELPEVVYQMQKEAFDQAKKLAGQAGEGIPGMSSVVNSVEPVKKVKDRATVEIKGDELTLKGGKTVKYKKG